MNEEIKTAIAVALPTDKRAWHLVDHATRVERWRNVERVLSNLTRHQRREHFDIEDWGTKTECGMTACAGGWCGTDPYFRKLGIRTDFTKDGYLKDGLDEACYRALGSDGVERIFYFNSSNLNPRSTVGDVIREVRRFIKDLERGKVTVNDLDYDWREKLLKSDEERNYYDWRDQSRIHPEAVA